MKLRRQLFIEAALAILSLLFMSTVALAWVAQNRDAGSAGQTVKIEPMGVTINSYEAYQYFNETNEVKKITEGVDLSMTPYDSIFDERNVNTPLLLVVRLRDIQKASDVTLNVTVKSGPELNEFAIGKNPIETDDFTSNLVHFKAATADTIGVYIDENEDDSAEYEKFFRSVCKAFDSVKNEKQFLTIGKGDDGNVVSAYKRNEITLTVSGVTPEEGHKVDLYLLIDYDIDLVEAQKIMDFGSIDLIKGNQVSFDNDIESIIFSYS